MPIYELWIKRAAHLSPEEHLFNSGARVYSPDEELDFNGEKLRIVDLHSEKLFILGGTQVVHRLTCIPAV